MGLIKCDVMFDEESGVLSYVNSETGKVLVPTRKKKVEDLDPIAKITLENGKFKLNNAAVTLMGVQAGDKIAIKYEINDKKEQPLIGTDEAWGTQTGNRLTKSNTVICRGESNTRLAKYGNIFTVERHETKKGLFKLVGNKEITSISEEIKEEIELPEELPFNLDELSDDIYSVNSTDFDFTF